MFTYNTLNTKLPGQKHYMMDFCYITKIERNTSLTKKLGYNLYVSCYDTPARNTYLESRVRFQSLSKENKVYYHLTVKFETQNDLFIIYLENCAVRVGTLT
jgi:hypothetical protein